MSITLPRLADDPALFLFGLDETHARLQEMTREGFARSIFLDQRIDDGGRGSFRVPLDAVVEGCPLSPPAERPVNWIFHIAQCGSTLLARALDLPGRNLVLREPAALRRLGVLAGADSSGELPPKLLEFTVAMLGKRWEADAPVVAKANVPVNFIAHEVMALTPDEAAITLYFPLESYVPAIMRTPKHGEWADSIFAETRLAANRWVADAPPATTAQRAAALWFVQMKIFEGLIGSFAGIRSLDASQFFAEPAMTIDGAAKLFGVELREGEAAQIAGSELFRSYSKNPALDYDLQVREAREAQARKRLAHEISEAVDWAKRARDRHGLGERLGRPLLGKASILLS